VRILLRRGDNAGPAIGSGINHFGFYVPNVKAAMAKWKDMGLKTEAGRNEQQGFVWTPGDLIRVEILEMPGQTAPVVFHHVHLFVNANAAAAFPRCKRGTRKCSAPHQARAEPTTRTTCPAAS